MTCSALVDLGRTHSLVKSSVSGSWDGRKMDSLMVKGKKMASRGVSSVTLQVGGKDPCGGWNVSHEWWPTRVQSIAGIAYTCWSVSISMSMVKPTFLAKCWVSVLLLQWKSKELTLRWNSTRQTKHEQQPGSGQLTYCQNI